MNADAVAAELAKPLSQQLLGSSIPARLAYIGVDGDPRVIPVGFLWDGTNVVVGSVPASAKVARYGRTRVWPSRSTPRVTRRTFC